MSSQSRKTILVLTNFSAALYDFRAELLQCLLRDYHVICAIPDAAKEEEIRALGCEIVFTPMSRRGMNPREDLRLFRDYGRLIKKTKPNLVLTFTVKPNVYGGMICRRRGIPYIAVVTGLGSAFWGKKSIKNLITMLERKALKKASCLFFQNTENMAIFEKHRISGQKNRLISGSGVNLKTFLMKPYPQTEGFVFLFVGRIMRDKGIDEFLAAAEALHGEDVCFQILGFCEDDYQEHLDDMERSGMIELLGHRADVREYYEKASAIVLPSYHEGMSNALLEASSTGRPVIASDIAGCREAFDEGRTGFGFAVRDSADLIRALRDFMAVPLAQRALMGRMAREKMGKEFDREKVVAAYLEEITAAIS